MLALRKLVWNARARALFLLAAAVLLGLHWTVGPSTTQSHAATTAPSAGAACNAYSSGVYCTLPALDDAYDVPSLLAQAQGLDSSVTADTPMGITAVGGEGARGECADCGSGNDMGGAKGAGGLAETQFTASRWESQFGSTMYYYIGANGTTSNDGATGGAATVVSAADLTSGITPCLKNVGTTCAASNAVLLIAGGGGGGGAPGGYPIHGGAGGDGGRAIATTASSAVVTGGNGGTSEGGGGKGGGSGSGGDGGREGSGADNIAGEAGLDGIGGLGGPVHTSSGPSSPAFWFNLQVQNPPIYYPASVGTNGEGGEGEWRMAGNNSSQGGGGGGGGGWGGGGGGGYGGFDEAGGGGGGGGSYADKAYVSYTGSFPTIGTGSQVVVAFITG